MIISSFSIMKSYVFQSTNEHKGFGVRTSFGDMVANQLRDLHQAGIWVTKVIVTWTKSQVGCILLTYVLFLLKMRVIKRVKLRLVVHIKQDRVSPQQGGKTGR